MKPPIDTDEHKIKKIRKIKIYQVKIIRVNLSQREAGRFHKIIPSTYEKKYGNRLLNFNCSFSGNRPKGGADEQEILRIHKSLDEAFLKKDVTAFERVFAEDFSMSLSTGKMMSRTEVIEDL